MSERILHKQIFFHPITLLLFVGFFTLRFASFLLHGIPLLQSILVISVLLIFIITYFQNPGTAWAFVITEILFDGGGPSFELGGISLRTCLLLTYIVLLSGHTLLSQEVREKLLLPKRLLIVLGLVATVVAYAALTGDILGNNERSIIQDALPFFFLFLLIPTHHYLQQKKYQLYLARLIAVFIVGSTLFALFTFILFSSGQAHIQGEFYKWFRDVAGGKITDLHTGFFRVVLPEHLLIPPLTLLLASLVMAKEKNKKLFAFLLACCLFILALNLSRAYCLGLFVGLFALLYKQKFTRWLFTSFLIGLASVTLFCGVYLAASRGASLGLEVFGLRLQSFVSPQLEESTYTRTALLQPIWQKIQTRPTLGSGLGSTVTFINPVTHQSITTSQFDWGYLELWTELGLIGTLIYLSFIFYILLLVLQYIKKQTLHTHLSVGLFAGIISLLIINLTAPALFHIFGIFFLTCTLALIVHTSGWWEKIKTKFLQLLPKQL